LSVDRLGWLVAVAATSFWKRFNELLHVLLSCKPASYWVGVLSENSVIGTDKLDSCFFRHVVACKFLIKVESDIVFLASSHFHTLEVMD